MNADERLRVQREAAPPAAGEDRRRDLLRESVCAAVAAAVVTVVYALTDAPLYNPPISIDPWLYTGLFVNFDFTYEAFGHTYYAARLPWVIPGYAAYEVLPAAAAYFVLNGGFLVAGATFVYLLARAYVGPEAAVVGLAALLGSQVYYNAHYWEYVDGVAMTFFTAAAYFVLAPRRGRARIAFQALGGFFAAAAVATHLLSGFFVLLAVAVAIAVARRGRRLFRALDVDAPAFALGAAALFLLCGSFAASHGGRFLFFLNQFKGFSAEAASSPPTRGWVLDEPKLAVPLALAALLAAALIARRRVGGAAQHTIGFGVAALASLVVVSVVFFGAEFVLDRPILSVTYNFSFLSPLLALATAAFAALTVAPPRARPRVAVAAAAAVAVALPVLAVYLRDTREWTGRTATVITLLLFVLSAAAVVGAIVRPRVGAVALAAAAFASLLGASYALAGSAGTFANATPTGQEEETTELALDLVRFLEAERVHETVPAFWYDAADTPYVVGLHSLYYYGFTGIGSAMPKLPDAAVPILRSTDREVVVLLCARRDCDGADNVIRRLDLRYRRTARKRLARGDVHLWVTVLRRPQLPPEIADYLAATPALVAAATVRGRPVLDWPFAGRVPAEWTSYARRAARAAAGVRIRTTRANYAFQLVSPRRRLSPGRYVATARVVVARGGMLFGVMETRRDRWLSYGSYWFGQSYDRGVAAVEFRVRRATNVHVVLANWSPPRRSSEWVVRRVTIRRVGSA